MKKIVCTPGTCGGSPRIEGTRLTCADIVVQLSGWKMTLSELLSVYPQLTKADLVECLRYCASKKCIDEKPDNFCAGCSLDRRDENFPSSFIQSLDDIQAFARERDVEDAFLGSLSQYLDERGGQRLWLIAEKIQALIHQQG